MENSEGCAEGVHHQKHTCLKKYPQSFEALGIDK